MMLSTKYRKWEKVIKKSGLFEPEYYLFSYPDVRQKDIDPIRHYIKYGADEGRNPNKEFDTKFYLSTYPDVMQSGINPLVHYILYGKNERRFINHGQFNNSQQTEKDSGDNRITDTESEQFVAYEENEPLNTKLKTVAFYLPQFHPFPENDKWWGKGFTEWTNVTKAKPNFKDHYQPHLPIHFGFYDLRVPEVLVEQAKLAKNYGIYGFNFYYYWFDGKVLMHKPFEILLKHKEIDINFCITWANENWTRRWDGLENDVLIGQNHSKEDSVKFIHHLFKYFEDERYIRVNNKPIVIVYRASIIPEIKEMGEIWREEAKKAGFEDLYLVCAQTSGTYDPNDIGFDAAMEFPPHTTHNESYSKEIQLTNPNFKGAVIDYETAATNALTRKEPPFKLFKTSVLSWDNTARRQDTATVFHGFSIRSYKQWMTHLYQTTLNNKKYADDEKLVFVNAWNEWAEGTHLEPDRKYGYAYLQATYDALRNVNNEKKIIVVSHDAHPHGAQYLALNIAKYLKEYFNYEIVILLNGPGDLIEMFEDVGSVYFTHDMDDQNKTRLAKDLFVNGYTKAIANTSVVGDVVEILNLNKIRVLSLIHEMKSVISDNHLEESVEKIARNASMIVFPSEVVKNDFGEFVDVNNLRTHIKPQGLFRKNRYKYNKIDARQRLLEELEIEEHSEIILNVAYGDYRKGIDIFVESGIKLIEKDNNLHFLWVGHYQSEIVNNLKETIKANNCDANFHFVGLQQDIDHYYAGSDLFYLTSREDPFPSVVLDAMNVGLPIIAFKGAGGFEDVLSKGCGVLVETENYEEITNSINKLLSNNELYNAIGEKGIQTIEDEYCFVHYLYSLFELLGEKIKKVSVVIPNYNYEQYIEKRITSIENQTYPIYEIIYLDDKSVDSSLEIAESTLQKYDTPFKIYKNESNSGSVYKQWLKGIHLASGEYTWIAEADDLASERFLETVIEGFKQPSVALVYTQSSIIDESGCEVYPNALFHTDAIDQKRWKHNYLSKGEYEIRNALVYRNTIPNVSACIFRTASLQEAADNALSSYKYCGDWYLYVSLLKNYDIAFIADSFNHFRKHDSNVTTNNTFNLDYVNEIIDVKRNIYESYVFSLIQNQKMLQIFQNDFIDNNPNEEKLLNELSNTLKSFSLAKSKNITFVTFNEEYGGSEVLWYEMSQKLALRGHKIQVVCKKGLLGESRIKTLFECEIEAVEVNAVDSNSLNGMVTDLVVFSTGDHNAGGALFAYCKNNKIDYVIINQLVKETMWSDNLEFLQQLFDGYRNAKKTFFTSKNNIDIFEQRMKEKLLNAQIHFNPIDIDRDDYVAFPKIGGYFEIAFPARLLMVHKGQDMLLEVLSRKKWKERNLVVNFYGQGPDEDKLKSIAKKSRLKNVRFLGYCDSMRKIWESNHAFILTSHMEGLPIVLLSAMFAGRVPIVTNVGGNSEVIIDNVNGFISQGVSVDSIDEVLERAWMQRGLWEEMGKSAREYILEYYPVDPIDTLIKDIES